MGLRHWIDNVDHLERTSRCAGIALVLFGAYPTFREPLSNWMINFNRTMFEGYEPLPFNHAALLQYSYSHPSAVMYVYLATVVFIEFLSKGDSPSKWHRRSLIWVSLALSFAEGNFPVFAGWILGHGFSLNISLWIIRHSVVGLLIGYLSLLMARQFASLNNYVLEVSNDPRLERRRT